MHEECVTTNSSQGTCMEVRDCTPILDLLKAEPLPQAKLEYLRKSQCGFHDRKPLVCCPQQDPGLKPPDAEVVEDLTSHRNLPLLRNDLCGPLSDDRIIGGNRVKKRKYFQMRRDNHQRLLHINCGSLRQAPHVWHSPVSIDSVRPVCLPIGLSLQEQNLVGKKLTVAGWGVTENNTSSRALLKVDVPVESNAKCIKVYKNQVQITETSQLCAGGERDGGQSCHGDSGGPLTYYGPVEGSVRIIQHGIVSFGPQTCGTTGLPAVYTRVGYYMKWILDNISS
ncbi:hypothetical protein J437_LFUL016749 [Ladona fulva]|uniref:CLIP domain-containing serine protease n=1 Tax=Ladona fulva TaxID=123851 RepID=A0A8K0P7X3_LADFU|nr:hypothetical protein J437_LFUL016749 [Ladona fulva]